MTNHRELLSYFSLTELPFTKEIPVDQLHLLPSVERNLAACSAAGRHSWHRRHHRQARHRQELPAAPPATPSARRPLSHLLRVPLLGRHRRVLHPPVGPVRPAAQLSPRQTATPVFRDIKEHVLNLNNSAHVHPVLLIDEAHLLSTDDPLRNPLAHPMPTDRICRVIKHEREFGVFQQVQRR